MVEGHGVHRVAALHRKRLVGNRFRAWSPNGRFKDGASKINGKMFLKIEAVGKNLFAFFGDDACDCDSIGINSNGSKDTVKTKNDNKDNGDIIVVHVHFGMAGNWAVYENAQEDPPPEPRKTNRLRLEGENPNSNAPIVADLHAMTLQHGDMKLYHAKRAKLGEDPLREDADPQRLWGRIQKTSKSIGALLNDQAYFTGPGNIYRAEILFKAGVHPDILGKQLRKEQFDVIWYHTVSLLRRGYDTGSILTVDAHEAIALGKPHLRRYIYNSSSCPRCGDNIKTWLIASRTCYACVTCQPLPKSHEDIKDNKDIKKDKSAPNTPPPLTSDCIPFNSHCARESISQRLRDGGPTRLTIPELRSELLRRGLSPATPPGAPSPTAPSRGTTTAVPRHATKQELVELFRRTAVRWPKREFVSSEDAAGEKAQAGEGLAVEHVAELAPGQAQVARRRGGRGIGGGGGVSMPKPDGVRSASAVRRFRELGRNAVKQEEPRRRQVTVFLSSERAAIQKVVVGKISVDDTEFHVDPIKKCLSSIESKVETSNSSRNITVVVSSKHAAIEPTVVGTILKQKNDRRSGRSKEKRSLPLAQVQSTASHLNSDDITSTRHQEIGKKIKRRRRNNNSTINNANNETDVDVLNKVKKFKRKRKIENSIPIIKKKVGEE